MKREDIVGHQKETEEIEKMCCELSDKLGLGASPEHLSDYQEYLTHCAEGEGKIEKGRTSYYYKEK